MSYRTITYLLAGSKVPNDWGSLPTDRPGTDDWWERWGHLKPYTPKVGDTVFIDDIDGKNWAYIGVILAVHDDSDGPPDFHVSFDAHWVLQQTILGHQTLTDAGLKLDYPVQIHLISQFR